MARQRGFEPLTHSLEGCCSILLSYWRAKKKTAFSAVKMVAMQGLEPRTLGL